MTASQERGAQGAVRVLLEVPAELLDAPALSARASLPDAREVPLVSADVAFAALGVDRSTGYRAIREGTFPLPIVRIGRVIRIPTIELRRLLGLEAESSAEAEDSQVD